MLIERRCGNIIAKYYYYDCEDVFAFRSYEEITFWEATDSFGFFVTDTIDSRFSSIWKYIEFFILDAWLEK